MFVAIAFHYPHPEHIDDLLGHMSRVVDTVRDGADGLIYFGCWREQGGARLLGLSQWESREAFEAALPLIGSRRGERPEEWSIADDELLLLDQSVP